jgi:uncharacterized membrane protein YozB (DUF420 family)
MNKTFINKIEEKKNIVINVFCTNNCSSFDFTNLYLLVGLNIIIVKNNITKHKRKFKKSKKNIIFL